MQLMTESLVTVLFTRFLHAVVARVLSLSPGKSGVWSLPQCCTCPGFFVNNGSFRLLFNSRALSMLPRLRDFGDFSTHCRVCEWISSFLSRCVGFCGATHYSLRRASQWRRLTSVAPDATSCGALRMFWLLKML